jgi:cell division protein FtsQ
MANRQDEGLTRSEKLRARRQKDHKESKKPPFGSSATRKQSQQRVPVTRRKPVTSQVINRKRGTVPVRLRSKGAEVRVPSVPRLQFGWRLISGAIFLLSLVAVVSFSSVRAFKVSAVNLEGAERLSGEAILSQVHLEDLAIIKVQPKEIESQIAERFPSLSAVRVSIGLPANLTVKVTERQPVARWEQNGQSLWIDSDGVLFPIRGEAEVPLTVIAASDPPGLPQAEAKIDENQSSGETEIISYDPEALVQNDFPQTTPEFVEGILLLNQYLPENTALQYNPEFGLGWQDPAGWLVYFGQEIQDIETKLVEYQAIVAMMEEIKLTPSLISLEFMHAPFYRLEQ